MVRKAPSEPIVTVTVSQGIGLHATRLVAPSAVRELNGSFSRANSRGAGVDARSEAFGPMNGCCLAISPYGNVTVPLTGTGHDFELPPRVVDRVA